MRRHRRWRCAQTTAFVALTGCVVVMVASLQGWHPSVGRHRATALVPSRNRGDHPSPRPPPRAEGAGTLTVASLLSVPLPPTTTTTTSLATATTAVPAGAQTVSPVREVTRQVVEAVHPPSIPPPPSTVPIVGDVGGVCPLPGTSLADSWGAPRSGGRRHKGIDIPERFGAPIYAPQAGTVTYRWSSLGGLGFHLITATGDRIYGAHLSREGAIGAVNAGTVIGYVGNTGNARRGFPHLHLEFHRGGSPVNPYPIVRGWCGG